MSPSQQDRPGPPHEDGASGREDVWGADELDELLANPSAAGLMGQVLSAAGAPAEACVRVGEEAARHAFRSTFPGTLERQPRSLTRASVRVAVAAVASGLMLSGAVGAAAVGALPGAAQQTAKEMLAVVGVSVPGPDRRAAVRPNQPGTSPEKPVPKHEPTGAPMDDERTDAGSVVSALARRPPSTDVGKGAAVSGEASDGRSHAGQHGQHGKPASSPPGKAKEKTHKPHPSKHPEPGTHKPSPTRYGARSVAKGFDGAWFEGRAL